MRTQRIAVSIVGTVLALPAVAAGPFSDTAYDVKVVYAGEQDDRSGCVTFDAAGRFAIAGRRGSVVWAQKPEFPDQFLAVSAPVDGTGVQVYLGVHGGLRPDGSLFARGIDQFGASFTLTGTRRKDCGAVEADARGIDSGATDAAALNPDLAAEFGSAHEVPCAFSICDPRQDPLRSQVSSTPSEMVDPGGEYGVSAAPCTTSFCDPADLLRSQAASTARSEIVDLGSEYGTSTAPCASSICDPQPNPLGGSDDRATAAFSGQSYALTLGSDSGVIEKCWTFSNDGEIVTAQGASLTWSPRNGGNRGGSFHSVGAGEDGRGMAYNGELEGNLLHVTGIEARDGKSMVTFGWGQPVAACEINR